jgi:hypothetical protein
MPKRIALAGRPTKRRDRVKRATLLAGVLAATLGLAIGGSVLCFVAEPTLPQLSTLWSSGRTAMAVATTTDPGNHAACTFVYTVHAHVYHGSASCPVPTVGDTFTVTYDPRDPPVVATDNPASALLDRDRHPAHRRGYLR